MWSRTHEGKRGGRWKDGVTRYLPFTQLGTYPIGDILIQLAGPAWISRASTI